MNDIGIFLVIFFVIGASSLVAFISNRKYSKVRIQNEDLHKKLVALMAHMKKMADSSNASFDIWAELSDTLLKSITEYYNGETQNQDERYETSVKYVETVYSKLECISKPGTQESRLRDYIEEIKTNKLNQQDAASGAAA